MSKVSTRRMQAARPGATGEWTTIPFLAMFYAVVLDPILVALLADAQVVGQSAVVSALPLRIFWPAMAAISLLFLVKNIGRLRMVEWPTHMICLFAYVVLCGLSVTWAFKPDISFTRYVQQIMLLICILLPALLGARNADLVRGLFICVGIAAALHLLAIFWNSPSIVSRQHGYFGLFPSKNQLGEFSAMTFLLAICQVRHHGRRRLAGIVVAAIAATLLILSNSKTALGLAFLAPVLASIMLLIRRQTRVSPAVIVLALVVAYILFTTLSGFNSSRLSYILYGDPTFTGRTTIWGFAEREIAQRPILGWGYRSFWLVGPDGPSALDAPGWVKNMPNSHSGYYDTLLELGFVGLGFLLTFLFATLHAVRRVAERDAARAHLLLTLALYVILYNFFESFWMRGFEILWVVFVVVAADIGRYLTVTPPAGTELRKGPIRAIGLSPSSNVSRRRPLA